MDDETQPDDDAGPLAALAVERVTDTVEAMHSAIAAPLLRAEGTIPGVRAGRRTTAAVYEAVRSIGAATSEAAAQHSATLGRIVPVGNALWGDELQDRQSEGAAQTLITDVIAGKTTGPDRAKRCAVLVHGLGETETVWHSAGIVDRLVEAGHPVVLVRYNTGRSVADSGHELAAAIDDAALGTGPLSLVGFSMGGLVAGAALEAARASSRDWVAALADPAIITIGTPHGGSPIEKGVDLASKALAVSPYSRPLAEFVERRSVGIQDLRHGSEADHPERVAMIAGTVAENPDGLIGRLFGDLVVRPASATAGELGDGGEQVVFGGVNHSGLLGDTRVQAQLLDWLAD